MSALRTWLLRGIVFVGACLSVADAQQLPETRKVNVGPSGKRIALVIGNDAYQKVSTLEKAGNDATAMARELKAAGFEVLLHRDLNYRGMVKAVETLSNSITGGDQVVVFFAGHGVQIKTGNYLLPIDIEANSESEVEKTAYGLNDLTDKLSEAKASFALVIVDACRDNPLKSKGRSIGSTRGLSAIEPAKGQIVVYSASKGQRALDRLNDGDTHPNGVFTREFIARMKRPGVRIEDLVREVQDAVEELARTVSHDQRPAIYNEARGNFYFFGPTTVQLAPDGGGSATLVRARTPEEIEDSYWDGIKDSREIAVFDGYLKDYPNGRYAQNARNRQDLLKAEARRYADQAVVSPVPASALSAKSGDQDTLFWNEVKNSGARDYLDAYLKQFPKGKYAALAKVEQKRLEERDKVTKQLDAERQRQEAQRAEQAAWDEAKMGNSIAAYTSYLQRYPNGSYAVLAQVAQQKLQREATELGGLDVTTTQRELTDTGNRKGPELRSANTFQDCADCPEMVVVPAGSFDMGDPGSTHRVSLKSFAIGKTEVTQRLWRLTMGTNPSYFKQCGDDCPVEQVSWIDAQEFVGKLSQKTGKAYRLPSEAEWEYACRAGEQHEYCGGDNVDSVAWYDGNSRKTTNPVASKQANRWGLHDMSGNVREWMEDCWNGDYRDAPADGTAWTSGQCSAGRVLRGGSWGSGSQLARGASRSKEVSTFRIGTNGFRLVRTLP